MTKETSAKLQLGLSPVANCSYLDGQQEQLLFVLDKPAFSDWAYEHLLAHGFRRSGNDIYRPHCPQCSACQSIRIPVKQFTPSTSQRRTARKTRHIIWKIRLEPSEHHYLLYERYISARHRQGSMYPPSPEQFHQFTQAQWLEQVYLEAWLDNKLIAVAVTDLMPQVLSALYTFYAPEYESLSLGTAAILKQIEFARQNNLSYLYLGYQIDACPAMKYKIRFNPHQKYLLDHWLSQEKASD